MDINAWLLRARLKDIISQLQQMEEARYALNLGDGIIFENHTNTLVDTNKEVQQSLRNLRLSNRQRAASSRPKPKDADQICVYKEADGTRSLCIVVEYKPGHKFIGLQYTGSIITS
jgi:hypothetical protein